MIICSNSPLTIVCRTSRWEVHRISVDKQLHFINIWKQTRNLTGWTHSFCLHSSPASRPVFHHLLYHNFVDITGERWCPQPSRLISILSLGKKHSVFTTLRGHFWTAAVPPQWSHVCLRPPPSPGWAPYRLHKSDLPIELLFAMFWDSRDFYISAFAFLHADRQRRINYLKDMCMCLIKLFLVLVQSEVIIQRVSKPYSTKNGTRGFGEI